MLQRARILARSQAGKTVLVIVTGTAVCLVLAIVLLVLVGAVAFAVLLVLALLGAVASIQARFTISPEPATSSGEDQEKFRGASLGQASTIALLASQPGQQLALPDPGELVVGVLAAMAVRSRTGRVAAAFLLGDAAWALAIERLSGRSPAEVKRELSAETGPAARAQTLIERREHVDLQFLDASAGAIGQAREFLRRSPLAKRFIIVPSGTRVRGADLMGACFRERVVWVVVSIDYNAHRRRQNEVGQQAQQHQRDAWRQTLPAAG